MHFVMTMNEGKSVEKLLHDCNNQKLTLTFLLGCRPVYEPSNFNLRALHILFKGDITQFHIDKLSSRRWTKSSVVEYRNHVLVGTFTNFIDGTGFVQNFPPR